MKKTFSSLLLFICCLHATAQQRTYSITTYTPPAGWSETKQQNSIMYSVTDKKKSWSQIGIYSAVASSGSPDTDFTESWKTLIAAFYHASDPKMKPARSADGWAIRSGSGKFTFQNSNASVTLTTFSKDKLSVSVVVTSNSNIWLDSTSRFLSGIKFKQPDAGSVTDLPPSPAVTGKFAFSETRFDDGWVSTIHDEWVEVVRNDIHVRIFYPKAGTIFPADPDPLTRAAWNVLVAPRYSSIRNFKAVSPNDFKRVYWASAELTDQQGHQRYVVLFRQGGGWIEFNAPDKNSFIKAFGPNDDQLRWDTDVSIFAGMAGMASYNKFAVAASDLYGTGTWKEHFSSNTFYSNYYTGAYEGMSTYSSSQWFNFSKGQQYTWQLVAANSYGGTATVAQGKGAGTFNSVGNWQLYFTGMEGKSKTFDVYFTAVKGGRVLWMNDAKYPGSGIFTGYEQVK